MFNFGGRVRFSFFWWAIFYRNCAEVQSLLPILIYIWIGFTVTIMIGVGITHIVWGVVPRIVWVIVPKKNSY